MVYYVMHTRIFLPDEHHDSVVNINVDALYDKGIRLLLIDLDNTLIPYDESLPNASNKAFFDVLKQKGFEVVLISNNHKSRVKTFADPLAINYVYSAKKPLKSGFKKALKLASKTYLPNQVCVIGDQIMTDVFGARRMKLNVILVMPIKKQSEKWYTRFNRMLENFLLRRMKKKHPQEFKALKMEKR